MDARGYVHSSRASPVVGVGGSCDVDRKGVGRSSEHGWISKSQHEQHPWLDPPLHSLHRSPSRPLMHGPHSSPGCTRETVDLPKDR